MFTFQIKRTNSRTLYDLAGDSAPVLLFPGLETLLGSQQSCHLHGDPDGRPVDTHTPLGSDSSVNKGLITQATVIFPQVLLHLQWEEAAVLATMYIYTYVYHVQQANMSIGCTHCGCVTAFSMVVF